MLYEKTVSTLEEETAKKIYKTAILLETNIKITNIAKTDIELFRKILYESIETTGINSVQTIEISNILNKLINIHMKRLINK